MASFGTRRGALNSAASFLGLGAGRAPQAAIKPKGDDDEDMAAKAKQAEEDAEKQRKDDARRARNEKAGRDPEDDGDDNKDDEDDNDEEGDDESDDDESKKGKKGDKGKKASAYHARQREKCRVATIIGHPAAKGRENLALKLALTTDMNRSQAIAVLMDAPRGGGSLADRMDGTPTQGAGPGATPISAAERGKSIVADAFARKAVTSARRA